MANSILAFAEQRNGKLRKTAFEVVSAAANVAAASQMEVVALLVGSGVEGIASELGKFGAAKVLVYDDASLESYCGERYAAAALHGAQHVDPAAILFPASATGKDLSPRVAAKLGTSVAADCVELKVEGDAIQAKRPIFAGKAYAWVGRA